MAKPVQSKPKTNEELRRPISILFVLGCLFSLIYLYFSHFPIYISLPLAFLVLMVTGMVITKANGYNGFYGLYMLKSVRGLHLIEEISRHNVRFWKTLAEWGAVLGFGLFSYVVFRKNINRKTLVLGLVSTIVIILVVVPNLGLFLKFLNIPGLSQFSVNITALESPSLSYATLIFLIIGIFGGFLFFMIALLGYAAFGTLYSIATTLSTVVAGNPNYTSLSQQVPGVVPVIPGLTIPLFSGILALAVVLIVHEFSHGILARTAKVKLKSIGLLPFGIIPIGAFVEPDDVQVKKLDKNRQNDIFIAGIASNFLLTFIFFALTAVMILYVMPIFFGSGVIVSSTMPGYPAQNVIAPGSIIYQWNGYQITNLSSIVMAAHNFTPYATVKVNTSEGNYSFNTNATGKIGVIIASAQIPRSSGPQNGVVSFLYSFFVLSFVLNFFVAGMNLLPLPFLDGWQIYRNRIKSKKTLHTIGWIMLIGLIILALPWIWVL
jgi:membrane-associated protease RseP (regulator of RpoE activity)